MANVPGARASTSRRADLIQLHPRLRQFGEACRAGQCRCGGQRHRARHQDIRNTGGMKDARRFLRAQLGRRQRQGPLGDAQDQRVHPVADHPAGPGIDGPDEFFPLQVATAMPRQTAKPALPADLLGEIVVPADLHQDAPVRARPWWPTAGPAASFPGQRRPRGAQGRPPADPWPRPGDPCSSSSDGCPRPNAQSGITEPTSTARWVCSSRQPTNALRRARVRTGQGASPTRCSGQRVTDEAGPEPAARRSPPWCRGTWPARRSPRSGRNTWCSPRPAWPRRH